MCNINDAYDMKLFTSDNMYEDVGWINEQQTTPVKSIQPNNVFSAQGAFDTYSKALQNYPTSYPNAPEDLQVRNETQPLNFDSGEMQGFQETEPAYYTSNNHNEIAQEHSDSIQQQNEQHSRQVTQKVPQSQELVIPIEADVKNIDKKETASCPMYKKNKHAKQNKFIESFTTGLRETIFILLIGIIIIFLLDILVRIGKKL